MKALLLLSLLLLCGRPAGGRTAEPYDHPLVGGAAVSENEIFYDDGTFELWGTNPSWAMEKQVGFQMPTTDPRMLTMVRLWVAGTQEHRVVIREAPDGVTGEPGPIIDQSQTFTPGYPAPPVRWIDVDLSSLSLVLADGQEIFVGVQLDGVDDGIGLDDTAPDGHSWGYYDGAWYNDTGEWGVDGGIRIVVTDTAFADKSRTWASIKALFAES